MLIVKDLIFYKMIKNDFVEFKEVNFKGDILRYAIMYTILVAILYVIAAIILGVIFLW